MALLAENRSMPATSNFELLSNSPEAAKLNIEIEYNNYQFDEEEFDGTCFQKMTIIRDIAGGEITLVESVGVDNLTGEVISTSSQKDFENLGPIRDAFFYAETVDENGDGYIEGNESEIELSIDLSPNISLYAYIERDLVDYNKDGVAEYVGINYELGIYNPERQYFYYLDGIDIEYFNDLDAGTSTLTVVTLESDGDTEINVIDGFSNPMINMQTNDHLVDLVDVVM